MGAHGKLTSRGRCLKCNGVIAWYKGARGYELRDPELDAHGVPVRMPVVEGGRETSRVVPGLTRHSCAAPVAVDSVPAPPLAAPAAWAGPITAATERWLKETRTETRTAVLTPPTLDAPTPDPTPATPAKAPEIRIPEAAAKAWARATKAVSCGMVPRILLYGPPGTAKTEFTYRTAVANGWTYHYQLLTEETPSSDLAGHLVVKGGDTVWCDGTVARAIRDSLTGPVMLCLDEIGRASADALSYCLLALQNPESMRLVTRDGEILSPKPENWHVVCTSNGEPAELPDPVRDRLHVSIHITHPHPDLVASLTTIEAKRLAAAVSREYSTRALLTYDRLRAAGWTLEDAAYLVWDEASARSFMDAVRVERGRR